MTDKDMPIFVQLQKRKSETEKKKRFHLLTGKNDVFNVYGLGQIAAATAAAAAALVAAAAAATCRPAWVRAGKERMK